MTELANLIALVLSLFGAPNEPQAPAPTFPIEQPAPVIQKATVHATPTVAPEDRWRDWTPAELEILPPEELGEMRYYRAAEGFCFGADSAYMARYNPNDKEDPTCDPQNPAWQPTPYTDPRFEQ